MPNPSLDVARARRMMNEQKIDVLLVVAPENFQYATGVVTLLPGFRHPGLTSIVVLPGDERLSPAAIVGDTEARAIQKQSWIEDVRTHPLWIESDDITEAIAANPDADALAALAAVAHRKPARRAAEIDMAAVTAQVVAALADRKLECARIGTEFEDIPASELHRFQRALPNATFVDATRIFRELRLIKTPAEIDKLRTAAAIAEEAMTTAMRGIGADTKVGDVFRAFQIEAIKIVSRRGADAITHYELGRANIGGEPWIRGGPSRTMQPGELIQFDTGVRLAGYRSDIGRTYAFQKIKRGAQQIHDALEAGWHAAMAELRPGRKFSDVFLAAERAVRANGIPNYLRGHIGHSIGLDRGEEPPAIGPDEHRPLEPGMVLAIEIPSYVAGVGGFQIEDNVLITATGHERFTKLPPNLTTVG